MCFDTSQPQNTGVVNIPTYIDPGKRKIPGPRLDAAEMGPIQPLAVDDEQDNNG